MFFREGHSHLPSLASILHFSHTTRSQWHSRHVCQKQYCIGPHSQRQQSKGSSAVHTTGFNLHPQCSGSVAFLCWRVNPVLEAVECPLSLSFLSGNTGTPAVSGRSHRPNEQSEHSCHSPLSSVMLQSQTLASRSWPFIANDYALRSGIQGRECSKNLSSNKDGAGRDNPPQFNIRALLTSIFGAWKAAKISKAFWHNYNSYYCSFKANKTQGQERRHQPLSSPLKAQKSLLLLLLGYYY